MRGEALYNLKKHIRWNEVIKTTGVMMIGALVTIAIILFFGRHAMNEYLEVDRKEYYDKRVKEIETQLNQIEK